MRTHRLLIVPWLILSLFLMAAKCPWSTTLINLLENALIIGLEAASISGALPPQAQTYVDAALGGIACASDEAASSDSQQVKAAKITECFSGAVAPVLPPGTAQNVVNLINRLSKAVAKILVRTIPVATVMADVGTGVKPDVVSTEDAGKLTDIAKRARAGMIRGKR